MKCRIRWAQIYEPEEYSGDVRWIGSFYPFDGAEWEKFQKSGLQMTPKEDAEGGKFVRLRRSIKKLFPKDDEATYFAPPKITGAVNVSYVNAANGEEVKTYKKSDKIDIRMVGEKVLLGNDTVANVNICVYDTNQGKGHRLESINVLDLVEYSPTPKTEQSEATVEEAPVSEKVSKTDKKVEKSDTSVKEDMNDALEKLLW